MGYIRASDLQGISRLVTVATTSVTDLVEAMHHAVTRPPFFARPDGRARGLAGLVYRGVRGVTAAVGGTVDLALAPLSALPGADEVRPTRDAFVAVLNGVIGDHLQATQNPLAIPMTLRSQRAGGAARDPDTGPAAAATGKVVVLVHGSCMNDRKWLREGHDHGAALCRDLGYAPLYLHYNSGLHISENGRAFAALLEETTAAWPVPVVELVIIGHSMGGLVARSACHAATLADHAWLRQLRALVFLGTPHHGAPLERGGNVVDVILGSAPYAAPLARLGHLRSAGITDLRYGYLLDEDWAGRDRFAFVPDARAPLPLPGGVPCFAMAATTADQGSAGAALSDGLVPLDSALGRHPRKPHCLAIPESRTWIGYRMRHLDLLSRPEVYDQLKRWLAGDCVPAE